MTTRLHARLNIFAQQNYATVGLAIGRKDIKMITVKPATTNIDGVDYEMELATIGFTKLGREDHGIFTFVLDLDYGCGGQGAGGYALNDPETFGKAVQGIIDFFGSDWEHIKGRKVYALKEEHNGLVKGLVKSDQRAWIMFSDWRLRRG